MLRVMIDFNHLNFVTLPLTSGKNENVRVPSRSGLNWGQRPRRNQNQAYLTVPSGVQQIKFFPEVGMEFKMICDDDFEMFCVRAQQSGKAIHSCGDNALMGLYFRRRLNLEPGQLVIYDHLLRYGRTSIDIYKREEKLFFLDFSNKTQNRDVYEKNSF